MKISVISDAHLGFGSGTERGNDSLECFKEAIEKSLGSDLILIAGDIFDNRSPDTETLARTMEILLKPMLAKGGAKISGAVGKSTEDFHPTHSMGIPVITIHGTHERRSRGLMNPVQALERAGFAVHLHCNGVIIEKGDGEKVCVQGLSGVPDQWVKNVLQQWDPKPEKDCFNIFMLHQSVAPFVPAHEAIELKDLPNGFDFYICGHAHEPELSKAQGAPFLIPGSLIPTQLGKDKKLKGIWKVETKTRKADFAELETQRKFYTITGNKKEVESQIGKIISGQHSKKPIIRIKLAEPQAENEIKIKFGADSILSFKKESEEQAKPEIKSLEEHRLSVQELGKSLLKENLKEAGLDQEVFENIFELIMEGKGEQAVEILRQRTK